MTTATTAHTGRRVTRDDGERTAPRHDLAHRVFAITTAIGLIHALDDAVLNRQPGVPVTQHLPALLVVTALAVTGVLLFGRLRTGLRAAMALLFGDAGVAGEDLDGLGADPQCVGEGARNQPLADLRVEAPDGAGWMRRCAGVRRMA